MPKTQENIVVNAVGGAEINLSATLWARKVSIIEDPVNGVAAGMAYRTLDDNFAATKKLAAGETLSLGDSIANSNGRGPIVGRPAQNDNGAVGGVLAATVYVKLVSLGAATRVRMTETE